MVWRPSHLHNGNPYTRKDGLYIETEPWWSSYVSGCWFLFIKVTWHERHSVSNYRKLNLLSNGVFKLRIKKTHLISALLALCGENIPVTTEFSWRMANDNSKTRGQVMRAVPDSKVHGANMGPTWVLSSPGGPHVSPMNLALWGVYICGRHHATIMDSRAHDPSPA